MVWRVEQYYELAFELALGDEFASPSELKVGESDHASLACRRQCCAGSEYHQRHRVYGM
jgi:hypothetical protein